MMDDGSDDADDQRRGREEKRGPSGGTKGREGGGVKGATHCHVSDVSAA